MALRNPSHQARTVLIVERCALPPLLPLRKQQQAAMGPRTKGGKARIPAKGTRPPPSQAAPPVAAAAAASGKKVRCTQCARARKAKRACMRACMQQAHRRVLQLLTMRCMPCSPPAAQRKAPQLQEDEDDYDPQVEVRCGQGQQRISHALTSAPQRAVATRCRTARS